MIDNNKKFILGNQKGILKIYDIKTTELLS